MNFEQFTLGEAKWVSIEEKWPNLLILLAGTIPPLGGKLATFPAITWRDHSNQGFDEVCTLSPFDLILSNLFLKISLSLLFLGDVSIELVSTECKGTEDQEVNEGQNGLLHGDDIL